MRKRIAPSFGSPHSAASLRKALNPGYILHARNRAVIPAEPFPGPILAALPNKQWDAFGVGGIMRLFILCICSVCLFAVLGSWGVIAPSSALAKPRAVEKHAASVSGKKHASAPAKKKKDLSAAKSSKSVVAAKREPETDLQPRTPTDKQDCIAVAQSFYNRAGALTRKTKQPIPPGFVRVVSKLDEFCGEEEFDKARLSIDWMNTCLQSLAGEQKAGACSNSESHLCAIDPQANACSADKRLAEY